MSGAPSFSSFPELPELSKSSSSNHHRQDGREPRHTPVHREERGSRYAERITKRSHSEERRKAREEKEKRRKRERREAEKLALDGTPGHSRTEEDHRVVRDRHDGKWSGDDQGVAWYEAGGKGKSRELYHEAEVSGEPFFSDIIGDRDALRYGQSSSYHPPRYHRDGHGRVLGCNEGLRIVRSQHRTEKGLELAPRGRPYIPRYSARVLDGSSRNARRLLLQPTNHDPFDPDISFVSFGIKAKRADRDEQPDYRSINKEEEEEDDDTAVIEETLIGFSSLEQEVQSRTAELDRHLRAHPDDIKAWIAYSKLHMRLSSESASKPGTDPSTLPQTRASAEVTLSVLSKALNHPPNFTSVTLHLAYIRAAEAFWPPEKVTGRWRNVLRELGERSRGDPALEAGMMDIWRGYIEWREGQGFGKQDEGRKGAGGVDEVLEVYSDCLRRLGEFEGDLSIREENQLYLFVRACLFMRQAGFVERAFACFQSLMEITLFKPDRLRPPSQPSPAWFRDLLAEYEVFWDSETARIGEHGAKGWKNSSTETTETPESGASQEAVEHQSSDPFERWSEAESFAESRGFLPGRATDLYAADDEDPYRVVLFHDIEPFLFPIRSGRVRLELVYTFLSFIGLPFRPPDVSTGAASNLDPHLHWSLTYNNQLRACFWPPKLRQKSLPWQTVGGEPMEPESQRAMSTPFASPVKSWLSTADTFFGGSDRWFRDATAIDLAHVDLTFARNVFKLLQPLVPDPSFTAMYMAFEASVSPKSSVKLAKTILSVDRDNAAIWDGYARLEYQRGNLAAARGVYSTVLQSDKIDNDERLGLYAAWARMEWDAGEEGRALEVLVLASGAGNTKLLDLSREVSKPTAISLLKAKQHYSSVPLPCSYAQLVLASLYAYLTAGIDAARDILTRHLALLRPAGPEAEEVFQLLCRMIYVHTSRNASPAALSRDTLELAIATFPNNTQFLSFYMFGELGARVHGRLQRLVSQLLASETSGISGQLWSVWAEAMSAHRTFWDKGGNGAERVRQALDKSINSRWGKRSAPMWILYIEFDSLMGCHAAAKQLCYRAVAALGGCKALYLLPFGSSLRPHFTPQELRDWADLMIERGLRLRVPFEEFFDVNETEAAIVLPEDEELYDDELGFLRDREELKPY
ncbi:NRDE-2, necessary for RNA interference-domain-containing protein [Kockovaella imperatae]|uniref:NRDE-2, necessary for RNA interference-domain-containing protein n=1 Tax=Kockovaella imperatae TaxID=4999 RepID=A0A1Y1UH21_9TREE|nr:NRDE-2, necessary for RNA interference-domain-containing protein [Kockovaella imperatae]ORX37353.1 NRDE-2, necessary for RNA interference-domain-containing protein [Kockovaella imperatae]